MFGTPRPTGAKRSRRRRPVRTRLFLEPLEDRTLLSVSIAGTIFNDLIPGSHGVAGITAYLDLNRDHVLDNVAVQSPAGPTALLLGANDPVPGTVAATAPLTVSGLPTQITHLTVHLDASYDGGGSGPITVSLISPTGFTVNAGPDLVTLDPGGHFNGTLDDQAASPVDQPSPTVTGSVTGTFQPRQAFTRPGSYVYNADPNGDWRLIMTRANGTSPPGVTVHSWSLSFSSPEPSTQTDSQGAYSFSDLAPGTYAVTVAGTAATADPSRDVTVTSDQPATGADIGVAPAPDLVGTSFQVSGSPTAWGQSVTVSYNITNQGSGDAGPFTADLRLSADGTIDSADPSVASLSFPGLAAGATVSGTQAVLLPSSPPSGFSSHLDETFLGLLIHAPSGESNTANNANQGAGLDLAAVAPPPNKLVSATGTGASDTAAQQMPSLAVDPANSNHIVLAYMDYGLGGQGTIGTGYAGIRVATSTDGGDTWTRTTLPLPSGFDQAAGYPHVAFDDAGHVYLAFMAVKFLDKKPPLIFPDGSRDSSQILLRSYGLKSNNGIFLARSDDGGSTWDASKVFAVQANTFDTVTGVKVPWDVLPNLAVDTTPSSPNYGKVFLSWYRIYPAGTFPFSAGNSGTRSGGTDIMVAVGTGLGASWSVMYQPGTAVPVVRDPAASEASNASQSEGGGTANFSNIAVDPQGAVYVSMFNGTVFRVFRSADGAASFTPTANPFTGSALQIPSTTLFSGAASASNPAHVFPVRDIVADPARPGTVYVADALQVINGNFAAGSNPIDKAEINFARSGDGGLAWQQTFAVGGSPGNLAELTPVQQQVYRSALNDDDGGRFLGFLAAADKPNEEISTQALPRLAADAQGNLVAIWYDLRRDPNLTGPTLMDVYGTVSTDGGLTWSPNFRITSRSFTGNAGAFKDAAAGTTANDVFLGDYIGLAAAGGVAYAAWTDTRNGNQDIFFARYPIAPAPAPQNDRYESNNDPNLNTNLGGPVNLGTVSVPRVYPRLALPGGDEDWYQLSAGAAGPGSLQMSVSGSAALKLELYNRNGQLVATGTNLLDGSGQVIGKQIAFDGTNVAASNPFFVRVFGVPVGAPAANYTFKVRSLTADLGTQVYAKLANVALPAGTTHRYTETAAVAGTLEINVSIPTLPTGANTVTFQVQNAADTSVLSTVQFRSNSTSTTAHVSIPVSQGQTLVLVITGSTASYTLEFTNQDLFASAASQSASRGLFYATPGTPTALAVADVNHDGSPDLVTAGLDFTNPVNVLLNDGTGLLSAPRGFGAGPSGAAGDRGLVLDDFSGDGVPDVAVSNFQSADVSVLHSRGDGTLAPERRFDGTATGDALASGDFNGDHVRDLVVLQRSSQSGAPAQLALLFGRKDGTFTPPVTLNTTFLHGAGTVVVADFNGDGYDDIAAFGFNEPTIDLFLNNGKAGPGTFGPVHVLAGPENTASALAADLNGDHKVDLITGGTNSGNVYVLLGNGDGTFQPAQAFFANTDPLKAATSISGLATAVFPAFGTGLIDLLVVAVPRLGGLPQINYLQQNVPPKTAPPGTFAGFASVIQITTGSFTGPLAVTDINADTTPEIIAAVTGGVLVIYGKALAVPPNTRFASARNLGTVVHLLSPTQAISPSATDAYFKFTVPTEAAAGAGDEVIDISALFQYLAAPGLAFEVLDAQGNPLPGAEILQQYVAEDGSGARFRVRAAQGSVLTLHVFGKGPGAAGAYTLDIDVLPQVVSVTAPPLLPGQGGQPGGPVSSLVLALQGDRLDPTTAETATNYRVVWAGHDGKFNTSDDEVIPLAAAGGGNPVVYDPGANTVPSSGRTFPTAVQQTVTLFFAQPLPAGSYRVDVYPQVQAAAFSSGEANLLVKAPHFTGHPVVSLDHPVNSPDDGQFGEGSRKFLTNLVQPAGPLGDLSAITQGTPFLTQFHGNSGSLLNSLQQRLGDDPTITPTLDAQVVTAIGPVAAGQPILVIWLDPVSIDLADPQGARTVYSYSLPNNTVQNNSSRIFGQTGGNIEVMVLIGLTGTYRLSISDVQGTARGGAVAFNADGEVRTVALTDAIRGGTRSFDLTLNGNDSGTPAPPPPIPVPPTPTPPGLDTPNFPNSQVPSKLGEAPGIHPQLPPGSGAPQPLPGQEPQGVALETVPAVSAVLFFSVTLRSGAVVTLTVPEGLGGDLEGSTLTVSTNGRVIATAPVGGPNERFLDPQTRRILDDALSQLADGGFSDLGGSSGTVVNAIRTVLQALGSSERPRAQPAGPAPVRPGPEENEDEILWLDPITEWAAAPAPVAEAAPRQEVRPLEARPAPQVPAENGAVWVDALPEEVAQWQCAADLVEGSFRAESPDAMSALLGLGVLAGWLARPWGHEEPEKRQADEHRRRPLPA